MDNTIEASDKYNVITVLGATAGGKTAFAAHLASLLDREIISTDSRQVYKRMDIGTGKDLGDYYVKGQQIPVHLTDIAEPGTKYNVFQYQQDFDKVYKDMESRGKKAILCGGSGMYIEAIVKNYELLSVPHNMTLRAELEKKATSELISRLASLKKMHNVSDTTDRKRLVRAIEIAEFYVNNPLRDPNEKKINHLLLGIKFDRDSRRRRITDRLKQRLDAGMVDEVKGLIDSGTDMETLIYYGLEYKYITMLLKGELTYNQMFDALETAIHQFAKRQMTWFRKMERDGLKIYWLDGYMTMEQKIDRFREIVEKIEYSK
jgi:tRNA dimethylallyltransferase